MKRSLPNPLGTGLTVACWLLVMPREQSQVPPVCSSFPPSLVDEFVRRDWEHSIRLNAQVLSRSHQ